MTLTEALAMLRSSWKLIALAVVSCLGISAYLTTQAEPQYQATARLYVAARLSTSTIDQAYAGGLLSQQRVASYAAIVASDSVVSQVVANDGSGRLVEDVERRVSVSNPPNTVLLDISYTDTDPVLAQSTATGIAQAFADYATELEVLVSNAPAVRVSLVQPAKLPKNPVSPRPRRDMALGLITGLALGVLAAALRRSLDRTVKGPAQLSELAQAPLLGMVPRIPGEAREPQATVDKPMSPEAEAYRALRTALRFIDVEAPLQTVLITSAGPSEGKTTTATHFAIALAQSGERVVLVDADLRRGSLLDSFGLPSGAGITSVVTGAARLEDVLQEWRELLMIVGTGPLPPNPAEILGSTAMAALLEELQEYADIVVIDAPPVLPVTDAVALSTQVDGVVLVGRDGKSTRTNIAEARRRLEGVGAHVVGCVLNGVRTKSELYADYRYLSPAVQTPTLGRRLTDRLRH